MSDLATLHGLLERGAERYRGSRLLDGMTPAKVRELAAKARPLDPAEVRRAAVRLVRPMSCGRGGLPGYVVDLMYADYLRLQSLAKVGRLHGRTRQSIYQIFKGHRKPLTPKTFFRKMVYRFQTYTPSGKGHYLRRTDGDRKMLHHQMWEDANGPIPPGHNITFKNDDRMDCRLDNLVCLPVTEQLALVRDGTNQFTPPALRKKPFKLRAKKYPSRLVPETVFL